MTATLARGAKLDLGDVAGGSFPTLLDAVKSVLRAHGRVELPHHGIDLVFDAGVVARCRTCHLSWHVHRTDYRDPAWWTCPQEHRVASTDA